MRTTQLLLPLFGLLLAFSLTVAVAQDEPAAPTPAPGLDIPPAQSGPTVPNPDYPDIESLRQPGSSEKLFPAQPAATPDPTQIGTGQGRGHRHGNGAGGGQAQGQRQAQGRRNRHGDQLVTLADADPLAVRVAYRRAKTVVMARDSGLADLLQQADRAGTDPEKRAFLKQYYTRLYAEVVKVDPSPELKKHVAVLKQVSVQRYDPKRREVGGDEDLVLGRGGGRRGGGRNR